MRIGEIVLIVALVAGMFLVLAFGFGTNTTDSNVGDVALATPEGMDCGAMEDCDMEAMASSDCGGCGGGEPVLAAFVDFSQNGEYELTGASLKNTGNSLGVYDADGNQIGSFNIGSDGTMVPSASQPNGNVVKSAYSGPPGDTYSKYKVYPASYDGDKSVTPLMAVDHSNGNVSVTPGGDITRKNASSYLNSFGTTGGGGGGGGSCGSMGGGGGGGGG